MDFFTDHWIELIVYYVIALAVSWTAIHQQYRNKLREKSATIRSLSNSIRLEREQLMYLTGTLKDTMSDYLVIRTLKFIDTGAIVAISHIKDNSLDDQRDLIGRDECFLSAETLLTWFLESGFKDRPRVVDKPTHLTWTGSARDLWNTYELAEVMVEERKERERKKKLVEVWAKNANVTVGDIFDRIAAIGATMRRVMDHRSECYNGWSFDYEKKEFVHTFLHKDTFDGELAVDESATIRVSFAAAQRWHFELDNLVSTTGKVLAHSGQIPVPEDETIDD